MSSCRQKDAGILPVYGMLNLIAGELGYRGIPFFYLDGQTPASKRVELCERFNEGEREVFLISLKAGGTG